jgi:hypothetical protein
MKNLIPVEGRPNLYRDKNSGAIVNTDNLSYQQHLKHKKIIQDDKNRIENLEKDVNTIKDDLSQIKNLIIQLSSKL